MKATLSQLFDRVRSSYWLIPSLMALSALGASYLSDWIDRRHPDIRDPLGWMQAVQPAGARAILATIAGSMITVAGVTFSITIASVSYATSQFAPRLLDHFLRDRGNQFTLGTFIATFLFCLLVLRTVVGDGPSGTFVPHAGVFIGLVLAVLNVGVLIFFIHHVPVSIDISNVVARIGKEIRSGIHARFPDPLQEGGRVDATERSLPDDFDRRSTAIVSPSHGYVEKLNEAGLLEVAETHQLTLRIERSPGSFVLEGQPLLHAYAREDLSEKIVDALVACYALGKKRTGAQDLLFRCNELIEIATRALSPGVNDPFTAMSCVDWLTSALTELGRRSFPSPYRHGDGGALRVVSEPVDYAGFCEAIFAALLPYASGDRLAAAHLLDRMADLHEALTDPGDRACVREHALSLATAARPAIGAKAHGDWAARFSDCEAVAGPSAGDAPGGSSSAPATTS